MLLEDHMSDECLDFYLPARATRIIQLVRANLSRVYH
jgi:hypothetical protein